MTAPRTAYLARWVLPVASAPIERGVVVVQGAHIAYVGSADAWRTAAGAEHDVRVLDLGHAVLMPGLVNAHSHLELTAMRGLLEGLAFRDWLLTLTSVRRELFDAESLLDSARAGAQEALRNGITTCADTNESGAPLEAMCMVGMRGIGYVEAFGPSPGQASESIALLRTRVEAFRMLDTSLVQTGVSPHAPYTVSRALFAEVARYARDERLPVAVHIAESHAETAFVRDGVGPFADGLRARGIPVAPQSRSPIALLAESGLLAVRPLLIHAIQVDDTDVQQIADAGATVVHCPISNAKLGHGIAPLQRMLRAGIHVGMGTDSVASNDRMDILGEARQATLVAALLAGTPDALSASDALRLATHGGAEALGLGRRIGTLEAGKDADLAAFPLDGPDVGPVHDPAVTLVHVVAGIVPASLVTVAGRELVSSGVLLDRDAALDVRIALLGERLRVWRHSRGK